MASETPGYPHAEPKTIRDRFFPATPNTRPVPWAKLLPGYRLSAVTKTPFLVVLGMYLSGGKFVWATVGMALLLSTVLWAVLYALNEAYDLWLEKGFAVPAWVRHALTILAFAIVLEAAHLSHYLGVVCGLMLAGQLAYSAPPVRLKRWWWPILFIGGILNPVLRMECGAFWGTHPIPITVYAVLILIHIGSTIRTRTSQRERDRRLGYHTAPRGIEQFGMISMGLGIAGAGYLCYVGVFPRIFLISAPFVIAFVLYAWSNRNKGMAELRRGWLLFAIGAALALAFMLSGRG